MSPRMANIAPALGFMIAAAAVQLFFFDRGLVELDEGYLVSIAARVAEGQGLYRDVQTGVAPGVYLFVATLFRIFGTDVIVTRIAELVINALIAGCLWWIARRVAPPVWAAFAPTCFIALVVFAFPTLTILSYSTLSILCTLLAYACIQRYVEIGSRRVAILGGVLLAASLLAKQNYGVLAVLALAWAVARPGSQSPLSARSMTTRLAPVFWPVFAVGTITLASFAVHGMLGELLESTISGVLQSQLTSYRIPMPPLFSPFPRGDHTFNFQFTLPTLFPYLSLGRDFFGFALPEWLRAVTTRAFFGGAIALLLFLPMLLWKTQESVSARAQHEAWTLWIFAALAFLGIYPSAIFAHLVFALIPLAPAASLAISRVDLLSPKRPARGLRVACCVVLVLAGVTAGGVVADLRNWNHVWLEVPHASLRVTPRVAAQHRDARKFIESCALPGEPIFAAPVLPLLYLTTERPNPTRYGLLVPGDIDEAEIVATLDRTRTRCVVLQRMMYPGYPAFSKLFPTLNRYLKRHFKVESVIGAGPSGWLGLVRVKPRSR